jgi:hypothetical protein
MKKTTILGGTAVLALVLAGACGGGGETGAGGEKTSTTSILTNDGGATVKYGDGPCGTCVAEACSDEIDACKADPECPAYLTCLNACPTVSGANADSTCVAACPKGSGTEAKKAIAELDLCRSKGPGAACESCGLTVSTAYTAPALTQSCPGGSTDPNPCFACIDDRCCDTYQACHDSADCQALRDCLVTCGDDAACIEGCAEQHAEGAALWGPYYACGIVRCATDTTACDPTEREACEACLFTDCGDAYAYFLSAPGGYEMEACIQACPIDDSVCDGMCYAAYPEAYAKWGDLASCVGVLCKGKC